MGERSSTPDYQFAAEGTASLAPPCAGPHKDATPEGKVNVISKKEEKAQLFWLILIWNLFIIMLNRIFLWGNVAAKTMIVGFGVLKEQI